MAELSVPLLASEESIPILGYWPIQTRGDPCRLLLHYLDVKFKEENIESQNSEEKKMDKLAMVFPASYWRDGDNDIIHSKTVPILKSICKKYDSHLLGRN